ncbi:MAG: tetratricopeptide repeat protein [Leptospirales bacterium]|nr:tetratricopeptide repeat protein [Leptospirales bacterium]
MKHYLPVRISRVAAMALLALGCGPSIPIRFPQFPDQTGSQLRTVTEGRRNVGIVAAESSRGDSGYSGGDWTATMEAALTNQISERGYFNLVDISSRKERLRELAYTQSGMTAESLQIGRELQINLLLIVRPTSRPKVECRVEQRTDYAGSALALASAAASGNSNNAGLQKKPTGVLSLTVYVQGILVNVETGRTLSYANSEPFVLAADVGDSSCPSQLEAFDGALQLAARNIASRLSPEVVTVNVPLLADTDELNGPNTDRVQGWLEAGNEWAESENFEQAAKSWQRALNESDGESVSALWNLAVYAWYSGDYDRAEQYFEKALDGAGPSWLDGAKRRLISQFREQKSLERGGPQR